MVAVALTFASSAMAQNVNDRPLTTFQERTYQGKPIGFWLKALRERNEELLSGAFEAIYSLDEDAWIAVPELTRVVAAPFVPIRVGRDSPEVIAAKVYDIAIRTEAIDTLTWIGPASSRSAPTLVEWALTNRVVPPSRKNAIDNELFIELVALDAEQKMRVAGAVAAFGPDVLPVVSRLLISAEASKRKLAVAILSQDALPAAAKLLESEDCQERELGLRIMKDMDLVVGQRYLDEFASQLEGCTTLTQIH
jgi:hypothetical protein